MNVIEGGNPFFKIYAMKRVEIQYINGHNKGQKKTVSEKLAEIMINAGRAKKVRKKEDKQVSETKELKNKTETK